MVFSTKKLQRYKIMLKRTINTCLPMLKRQNEKNRIDFSYSRVFTWITDWLIDQILITITETNSLKKWFIFISNSNLNFFNFCRLCYEAKSSTLWKIVEQRVKNNNIQKNNASCEARFARIRHFMSRIKSHLKTARVLVKVKRQYSQLFTNYSIEFARQHLNFTPPFYKKIFSINDIVNWMITDFQTCEYYQKKIHFQNKIFHFLLEKHIRNEY